MRSAAAMSLILAAALVLSLAALSAPSDAAHPGRAPEEGLHITSPGNGTHWNVTTMTITWKVVSPAPAVFYYELKVDDGPWMNNSDRTSVTLASLEDGWHLVQVRASGELGQSYGDRVEFEVDTVAPTLTSRSPQGVQVPLSAEIMVTFSEDMEQGSVSVSGVEGSLTWGAGGFALVPYERFLPATEHTVRVAGTDLAGNHLVGGEWSFRTTDRGSVSGVVRDERNYSVSGVKVRLLDNGTEVANASTDPGGHFLVEAPEGSYDIEFSSPAIETLVLRVNVTASYTFDLGVVDVVQAPDDTWLWILAAMAVGAVPLILVAKRRERLRRK